MAEEIKKSNRDLVGERLKSKYPDREYADDDALFGQIDNDYNDYEQQLAGYREREGKFSEMLARDPKSARFIKTLADGGDPWVATIEMIGVDGITDIMNNPEKKKEYAEANKRYLERVAKSQELEEEYNRNFVESMGLLARMQQERGLSDEAIDAAYDFINKIANEALHGKYTAEAVEMALKAVNHDAEVENARSEGEIAGRNARIEENLRKPQQGDGVPAMGGSGVAPQRQRRASSIFDVARDAE